MLTQSVYCSALFIFCSQSLKSQTHVLVCISIHGGCEGIKKRRVKTEDILCELLPDVSVHELPLTWQLTGFCCHPIM